MTLNQLAEQIINEESGGSQSRDSQLLFPDVVVMIRQVCASLLKLSYFESVATEDIHDIPHHFIYPTLVDVSYDSTRKQSYITLPEIPTALPGNKGFRSIGPKGNPAVEYPIINSGQAPMTASFTRKDQFMCYPENNKVWFTKDITPFNISQVYVKVVAVAPESLDPDTEVYIPYDFQQQIFEGVRNMIQMKPMDKANDANPTV